MRAWQFAAGALIWLCFKTSRVPLDVPWSNRHVGLLQVAGWLGLLLVALSGGLFSADIPYPGLYALLPTLGAVGIIAAGCVNAQPAGVSRVLSWRPLQWLGGISYSWYLWHWPILLLGRAITGSNAPLYRIGWVLLSLVIAWFSCRFIESPIRNRRQWLVRPRMAIFAALALILLANSLCVGWNNRADERTQLPGLQRYAMAHGDAPAIYGMGCDDWYQSDRVRICAFGPADATHTAVLMGDSHAGQWFPAVAKVFDWPDWRLLVLTKSSCPMVDEPFFYARIGKEYTVCATWRAHALAQIARIKPDVMLLGTTDTNGFSKEQWIAGTVKVLDILSPAVRRIWLLRDTPNLPFDGPDCLAEHLERPARLGLHACSAPEDNAHAGQVYQWLGEAAGRFANVGMLDMNAQICPGGVCSAERNGLVVFRDNQHLTGSFAASLGPAMAEKLGIDTAVTANKSREAGAPQGLTMGSR